MRLVLVLCTALAALVATPVASSGGWATVGFAPLPDGMSSGGTWHPAIFVKQHGVTPLVGLTPVVRISDETGATETFIATDTSEPGVYEADVVFPTQGDWRVVVDSGFGDSSVSYGPVSIGAPAGGAGGIGELPAVGLGVALLTMAAGAALLVARRSKRLTPASG